MLPRVILATVIPDGAHPKGQAMIPHASPHRLRRALTAAAAIAALVSLAACAPSDEDAAPSTGGTLTIASPGGQPTSWDPALSDANFQHQYMQPLFDSLIRKTADGSLEPMLASDWSYDDEQTTLTLTIRDDVTFSDGTELDAEAVAANLERFPTMNGTNAADLTAVTDVSADGETVVLTLDQPDPGLLDALSGPAGLIASPESLEDGSVDDEPVGTGPYTLDTARTTVDDTYTYAARDDYWDPDLQEFDTIVVKVLPDATARLNALQSGQADAGYVLVTDMEQAEQAGLTVQAQKGEWSGVAFFDRAGTIVPALADVRVRQAIAYAIDADTIVDAVYGDHATATDQIFGESSDGFVADLDDHYAYDPEKATQLLAEAGYGSGLELSLLNSAVMYNQTVVDALTQQLGEVGVTLTWTDATPPEIIERSNSGQLPVSIPSGAQRTAWDTTISWIDEAGANNPLHVSDPNAQDLIADIRAASDDDRPALYQALNEYVVDQAWFAPIARIDVPYASRDTVEVELQIGQSVPPIYNFHPAP